MSLVLLVFGCCLLMVQCTYLRYLNKQSDYRKKYRENHLSADSKHLIENDTFFMVGRLLLGWENTAGFPMAIAAINRKNPDDLVDITHLVKSNSFFGLHVPKGQYELLLLRDRNRDWVYEENEVEALQTLDVNAAIYPNFVGEISLSRSRVPADIYTRRLRIPVVSGAAEEVPSLFYPKGSIKSLDDPLFAKKQAIMGMYAPAAFMERAPMLFYAMEEDLAYKTPVIFVHGIGGSPREFKSILEKLDRRRYKPWFFYYPSGSDLDKSARLFYRIFLSGKVIPKKTITPTIIVAHSMGGLVVRQAFHYYKNASAEQQVQLFVSISSPFQGHPSVARGIRKAPMVIPSWRNLDPSGSFIEHLFQKPLPPGLKHHLIYTSLSPTPESPKATDGVVPTASQRWEPAIAQANGSHHFRASHTDILSHEPFLSLLFDLFDEQESMLPSGHLPILGAGGFRVDLSSDYSPLEAYAIHNLGHYLNALDQGLLKPVLEQEHQFLRVIHGDAVPKTYVEKAWKKFRIERADVLRGLFEGGH